MWMPYPAIWTCSGKFSFFLGRMQHHPSAIDEVKACKNEQIGNQMNRVGMGIAFKAENCIPEMTTAMSKDICLRKLCLQPPGEKIDGQRKAVHFNKQGHNKGRKGSQTAPVKSGFRFNETVSEKNNLGYALDSSDYYM